MFSTINSKQCLLVNNVFKLCSQQCQKYFSSGVRCKAAIVTGAARGIGFHIAQSLLDAGAHSVVIADILEDECRQAAAKLNQRYGGPRAFPHKCDVSNSEDIEKLFQRGNLKYTDIIINNAGIEDNQNYEQMLRTNINGIIHGTILGFKYLRRGGTIINVSSIDGLQPSYYSPIYSGVNAFSIGFSRSFGHEYFYKLKNIRLMALCPGFTKTHIQESKHLGLPGIQGSGKIICSQSLQDPEEVGNCVITMLEDGENASVWIVENNECYKCVMPDRMSLAGVPEIAKQKHNCKKTHVGNMDEVICKKDDPCVGSNSRNNDLKIKWTKHQSCTRVEENKNPCDMKCNYSEKSDPCKKSFSSDESDHVSNNCTKQPVCANASRSKNTSEKKESHKQNEQDPCQKSNLCKASCSDKGDEKIKWTKQPVCSEANKPENNNDKNKQCKKKDPHEK